MLAMKQTQTKQESRADQRRQVGEIGESAVRERVKAMGWTIVDHNVRWREGELDLIALDARDLVVAEVKTLVARGPDNHTRFSPFESIDRRKQDQIRSLARRWLADELRKRPAKRDSPFNGLRFDAFAVTLDRELEVVEIEHLADAF